MTASPTTLVFRNSAAPLALALWLAACGGGGGGNGSSIDASDPQIDATPLADADPACVGAADPELAVVTQGLSRPVVARQTPGDASRIVIGEQRGLLRMFSATELLATPFLDLTDSVPPSGSEVGLLGLAFHPNYADNGRFFVLYTEVGTGALVIDEFVVSTDANVAEPAATATLYRSPGSWGGSHFGGDMHFGADGMLYVATGDGGTTSTVQDLGDARGKMLRFDVGATPGAGGPAAGNPFAEDADALDEVWARGLRVPWRWSFDRATGDLYIADVGGRGQFEEITVIADSQAGANFGWPAFEGDACNNACDLPDLVGPTHQYAHSPAAAVVGGYVYRGDALPCLRGTYFYADYVRGSIHSFQLQGQSVVNARDWSLDGGTVVSFAEDQAGELYLVDLNGRVLKLVPGS